MQENLTHRQSIHRPEPKEHEKRHRELMQTDAEYHAAAKAIESVIFPHTFYDQRYVPTIQEHYDEMERKEANLGRYPFGFRHYENYNLYRQRYPDATLDDYTIDGKQHYYKLFSDLLNHLRGIQSNCIRDIPLQCKVQPGFHSQSEI